MGIVADSDVLVPPILRTAPIDQQLVLLRTSQFLVQLYRSRYYEPLIRQVLQHTSNITQNHVAGDLLKFFT